MTPASCPFYELASPPGFHVTHIPKGNLVYIYIYIYKIYIYGNTDAPWLSQRLKFKSLVPLSCRRTAAVAATVPARLLFESWGRKCWLVLPCPRRSTLAPLLRLCVRSHRKHSTHTHAQTDALYRVAVTKGRAQCSTIVVPWLPLCRGLESFRNDVVCTDVMNVQWKQQRQSDKKTNWNVRLQHTSAKTRTHTRT